MEIPIDFRTIPSDHFQFMQQQNFTFHHSTTPFEYSFLNACMQIFGDQRAIYAKNLDKLFYFIEQGPEVHHKIVMCIAFLAFRHVAAFISMMTQYGAPIPSILKIDKCREYFRTVINSFMSLVMLLSHGKHLAVISNLNLALTRFAENARRPVALTGFERFMRFLTFTGTITVTGGLIYVTFTIAPGVGQFLTAISGFNAKMLLIAGTKALQKATKTVPRIKSSEEVKAEEGALVPYYPQYNVELITEATPGDQLMHIAVTSLINFLRSA